MDWNLLALSFITVFLSELGDKSQIAAIVLSGSSKSLRAVFLGAATALLFASLLSVLLGGGAGQVLPIRWVKGAAAIGFALMGVRLLWKQFGQQAAQPGAKPEADSEPSPSVERSTL